MDIDKQATTTPIDSDVFEDALVEEFGYTPTYYRVFKTLGSMSMTLAMASPMLGVFVMCGTQIWYGGYWGLTWGWVIPAICFFPWALATAELCSSMPVNGGNYWWAAALAPPSISRPMSFVTGITNVMNAVASMASFAWAIAQSITTVIGLFTGWEATNAIIFAISLAVSLLWLLMAFMRMQDASSLYIFNSAVVLITTAFFMIGMPVVHHSKGLAFSRASDVFGQYENYSSWQVGVAAPYTFLAAAWVITGWNAPSAIAEETHNARIVAPKAIVTTYSLMAILGFFVLLILSFCITDIEAAANDPSGIPAYSLVMDRFGLKLGFAFLLIVVLNTMFGGASVLVMMSCQIAAFARDGGLVYNDKLSYIWPRSNMPIFSSIFVTAGGMILLCLGFSPVASDIIYSLAVIAIMILYALPMAFRVFDNGRWVPGPWHYGIMSKPIHAWSVLSIAYMTILICFPSEADWTGATLNYDWAVMIAAILIGIVLWFTTGSRNYRGPDQEALQAWRYNHLVQSTEAASQGKNVAARGGQDGPAGTAESSS